MAKALVFLAEGFEEIEAVTVIDVLRRANVSVTTAALTRKHVVGAHDITIEADCLLDDLQIGGAEEQAAAVSAGPFDALLLPGGMPGSRHLRDDPRVRRWIVAHARAGRLVAAICAAPIALEAAGILKGRRATSFPGMALASAVYREDRVVVDGNVVTSRGPGTALEFALILVEQLVGAEPARQLRTSMLVD